MRETTMTCRKCGYRLKFAFKDDAPLTCQCPVCHSYELDFEMEAKDETI